MRRKNDLFVSDDSRAIRVILADAQPVFRQGVRALLSPFEALQVMAEVGNTQELLVALRTHLPDILILDYNPTYFDGQRLAACLAKLHDCKVIIISSQDKKWNIFKSLSFNVYCYLTKECSAEDVHRAVRLAAKGEKFLCSYIVEVLLGEKINGSVRQHMATCLTEREIEITRMVAMGKANKEIATLLNLSPHTIHSHRKNILKKLDLHSALDLANYAKETGIL